MKEAIAIVGFVLIIMAVTAGQILNLVVDSAAEDCLTKKVLILNKVKYDCTLKVEQ